MDGFRLFLLMIFLVGFAATIAVARRFRFSRYRLDTSRARRGIICLEVAGSAGSASEIIASWRAERLLDNFRPNIDLDSHFFIPCYTVTLVAGCAWTAGAFDGRWATLGAPLTAAQALAGALDYVENAALLRVFDALRDPNAARNPGPWPAVAALCAWPKFALVTAGAVYIIAGMIAYMWHWLS